MDLAAAELLLGLRTRMAAVETRLDQHDARMDEMAELTEAALADMSSAIDEVTREMDELADQVAADDARTADRIRSFSQRMRDLRPDVAEPTPAPPDVPPAPTP